MESMVYRENSVSTLGADRKHCHACANILDVRAGFCPRCGVPQAAATPQHLQEVRQVMSSRNRIVAVVLALFLGGIGVHKFYLGRTTAGVFYLLFCWTLIPSIIAFFEMIALLVQSDEAFARTYPG